MVSIESLRTELNEEITESAMRQDRIKIQINKQLKIDAEEDEASIIKNYECGFITLRECLQARISVLEELSRDLH